MYVCLRSYIADQFSARLTIFTLCNTFCGSGYLPDPSFWLPNPIFYPAIYNKSILYIKALNSPDKLHLCISYIIKMIVKLCIGGEKFAYCILGFTQNIGIWTFCGPKARKQNFGICLSATEYYDMSISI